MVLPFYLFLTLINNSIFEPPHLVVGEAEGRRQFVSWCSSELDLDFGEHVFVWPGMAHVDCGRGMEFGPVEKAVKGLLVFLGQRTAKPSQSFTLFLQHKTKRHDCPAHVFFLHAKFGSSKPLQNTHHLMSCQGNSCAPWDLAEAFRRPE